MVKSVENSGLDPQSFNAIAELAYKESGLQLVAEKTSMIQSRLRHRLKAVGLESFESYASLVCSPEGVLERKQMISALTTNVSHFFRENHHFELVKNKVLPGKLNDLKSGKKLRLWSAGCSNGQEALTIAMTLYEFAPEMRNLDFKILATDIDPNVVDFAKNATYPERLVSGIPEKMLGKYFDKSDGTGEPNFIAKSFLRERIVYKELNLLSDWPLRQKMDVIFCRNVVIYFDLQTQNNLWPRFRQQLTKDGYLFLGHSERIADPVAAGFVTDGPTSYRPHDSLKN